MRDADKVPGAGPAQVEDLSRQIVAGRRRMAVWALSVSIVAHALLFAFFPDILIEIYRGDWRRKDVSRIALSRSPHEEKAEAAAPGGGEGRFRPEDPRARLNLPQLASEYRLEKDLNLTIPGQLPTDWMAGDRKGLAEEPPRAPDPALQPRQDVLRITEMITPEDLKARRHVLRDLVPRVTYAPDIVLPVDRPQLLPEALQMPFPGVKPGGSEIPGVVAGGRVASSDHGEFGLPIGSDDEGGGRGPGQGGVRKIENLLSIRLETFFSPNDRRFGYFKMDINRAGAEALPVMPKDVVFVQDCSASITEQRLYFCREGLRKCLADLRAGDRFNVVAFSNETRSCFTEWQPVTTQSVAAAMSFVKGLASAGETDISGSLRAVAALPQEKGRPVVVLMVSDGRPTMGVTDSTAIIEQFSGMNGGVVSVFTMGTIKTANTYLLDLLGYRNRGDVKKITRGRWEIPELMLLRQREVDRPVLTGLRHHFSQTTPCDVYPSRSTHMYLDRPLVLYGRYPRELDRLVFQIVGEGRDTTCDMIFVVELRSAAPGTKDIRTEWARQRIYHLIGEHTRSRDPGILEEIKATGRLYDISVPYRNAVMPR